MQLGCIHGSNIEHQNQPCGLVRTNLLYSTTAEQHPLAHLFFNYIYSYV